MCIRDRLNRYDSANIYSHNGGKFDNRWILNWLIDLGVDASELDLVISGGKIIRLTVGGLNFLDTKAIIPLDLFTLTSVNDKKKIESPIPYEDYSRDLPADKLDLIKDYCVRDVVSLAEAMETFIRYAEDKNLDLGLTIGSSAWRIAKRLFSLPAADYSFNEHQVLRRAYYGGRVEVFKLSAPTVNEYDINSAYPDALVRTKLPVGKRIWLRGDDSIAAYKEERPGIYAAKLNIPDFKIPPLPKRTPKRLVYPIGTFGGWYPIEELKYAESIGCEVSIETACAWSDSQSIMKDWCQYIWDLRHEAGKKTPIGKWLKLYANSITGKFGQRPTRNKIFINVEPEAGMTELLVTENLRIYTREVQALASNGHVPWAAYLTAATRVKLHKYLIALNGSDTVYCDTDSCICEGKRNEDLGPELGQWEGAGPFFNFEALAPKIYRFKIGEEAWKIRAKGIPMPRDNQEESTARFEKLKGGERIEWHGLLPLKRAMQKTGRAFAAEKMHRSLKETLGMIGGRFIAPNGIDTLPPVAVEK
jgi:hypothetical protein